MAVDTFIAYVGVYPSVDDAEADYQLVKDLHTTARLIDAYDAAVIERRADGKVKITKRHEAKIEQAMRHAEKVQAKQLKADTAAMEDDAKAASGDQAPGDS